MKLLQFLMVTFATVAIFSCTPSPEGEAAATTDAADTAVAATDATTFEVNASSSSVNWEGTKPGGNHVGTLNLKSGSIAVKDGKIESGDFVLDMSSIVCTDEGMDDEKKGSLVGHLASPDFFDVAKFPEAKFAITSVNPLEGTEGMTHTVQGNLTMKDKTMNVAFPANINVTDNGVSAESNSFIINRTNWGITYKSATLESITKEKAISDEIGLKVKLVAN